MPEDTKVGIIQSFLDSYKGTQDCSELIYAEALNHPFDELKQWEINEIMNNCIEGVESVFQSTQFCQVRQIARVETHTTARQ